MYNTILKLFVSGIYRLNMIKNLKFVSLHPIFEMVHEGRVKNFNNPIFELRYYINKVSFNVFYGSPLLLYNIVMEMVIDYL